MERCSQVILVASQQEVLVRHRYLACPGKGAYDRLHEKLDRRQSKAVDVIFAVLEVGAAVGVQWGVLVASRMAVSGMTVVLLCCHCRGINRTQQEINRGNQVEAPQLEAEEKHHPYGNHPMAGAASLPRAGRIAPELLALRKLVRTPHEMGPSGIPSAKFCLVSPAIPD